MNIGKHSIAVTTVLLGAACFALAACGGAPDTGSGTETTGKSAQDLSVFGIPIPAPTISVGIGDAGIALSPLTPIQDLLPPTGIRVDPVAPVNDLLGAVSQPISVGVTAPGIEIGLQGGIQLPKLPDPFEGGIPILTP
jgi:hypothetical protein